MVIFFWGFGISVSLIFTPIVHAFGSDYEVKISNNGPAVLGANITFVAELRKKDGKIPDGEYLYKWKDNLYPQHIAELYSKATSNWTVSYPTSSYRSPGRFFVTVAVFTKTFVLDWPLCDDYEHFELTGHLNGNLTLLQDNVPISTSKSYVSNSTEVVHEILLTTPDLKYIQQNSKTINTYWCVDRKLVGKTNNLTFHYNYTQSDITHSINALVVVTNGTSPNSSIVHNDQAHSSLSSPDKESSEIKTSSGVLISTIPDSSNHTESASVVLGTISTKNLSFDCEIEETLFANFTHGLFSQNITVIAPIANVTANGNQWIQHSDMLNLTITCQGSPPFKTCFKILRGDYNATGNETCDFEDVLETCSFTIPRYFLDSTHYSILIIIRNDINKIVRSIGIDVYEVTKHPQLSVIVVPISAAIVAIVLIIFGIAYYIQSRNRFMIEVADFDFSTNASDMEYKTFRERLVEAFHNAFDKTEDFYEQDISSTAPTNKKYGSMP